MVDCTHLCGAITGIERITLNLFSPDALAPLDVVQISAANVSDMIIRQNLTLPLMLARNAKDILICPGFPPATTLFPFQKRVIPYIHDTFLLSRWTDLNMRAKLYMALPFRLAVATYPKFFVNSETTYAALSNIARAMRRFFYTVRRSGIHLTWHRRAGPSGARSSTHYRSWQLERQNPGRTTEPPRKLLWYFENMG